MTNEITDGLLEDSWHQVCENLRSEIGEAAYQSWVKPMTVRGVADSTVRISVPTRFMRDWVVAHYVERLGTLWNAVDSAIGSVEISIQPERSFKSSAEDNKATSTAATAAAAATTAAVGMATAEPQRASDIGAAGISGPPYESEYSEIDNRTLGGEILLMTCWNEKRTFMRPRQRNQGSLIRS